MVLSFYSFIYIYILEYINIEFVNMQIDIKM